MNRNGSKQERLVLREKAKGRRRISMQPTLLALEDRTMLSPFVVMNNADSGAGSLRAAITALDATSGGPIKSLSTSAPAGSRPSLWLPPCH